MRAVFVLEYDVPDGANPGAAVAELVGVLRDRGVGDPVGSILPGVMHVAIAGAADRVVKVISGQEGTECN
jgi:hypothetical protein